MKSHSTIAWIGAVFLATTSVPLAFVQAADKNEQPPSPEKQYLAPKLPEKSTLSSTGRNPYFVLEPGYQLLLKKAEGPDTLTVTVLNETRTVDGVETRVVEERETENGQLLEVSRNYFAISKDTRDLFYFGEDVDIYKDGKVTGHGGAWLAGVDGAKPGLMLPGEPKAGMRFLQEQAGDVARDRSEVVSTSTEATTPAGKFTHCLKVSDDSATKKEDPETKVYAPSVGLIVDEDFRLAKYGKVDSGK